MPTKPNAIDFNGIFIFYILKGDVFSQSLLQNSPIMGMRNIVLVTKASVVGMGMC